jgi:hypothetical protein
VTAPGAGPTPDPPADDRPLEDRLLEELETYARMLVSTLLCSEIVFAATARGLQVAADLHEAAGNLGGAAHLRVTRELLTKTRMLLGGRQSLLLGHPWSPAP